MLKSGNFRRGEGMGEMGWRGQGKREKTTGRRREKDGKRMGKGWEKDGKTMGREWSAVAFLRWVF